MIGLSVSRTKCEPKVRLQKSGDPRRGIILVAVLWSVTLVSALAMAASTTFRSFTGVIAVQAEKVKLDALLVAGLESAAGLVERLGQTPLREFEAAITLPTGAVRVRLNDESGRIDVSKAPVELLASLFRTAGAHQGVDDMAKRWVTWRETPGNEGSADVEQVARVLRLPPDFTARLAPLTTALGRETVNPLAASPEVLAVIPGLDRTKLANFLNVRNRSPANAERLLPTLGSGQRHLEVKPRQAVSVDLSARLQRGLKGGARAVIVLLSGDSQPYRVLVWNPVAPEYPR